MPAIFSNSPYPYNSDDIDWNPSTGATSNRDLPWGDNNNNRRRRRDVSSGPQGIKNAWGVEDNVNGGTTWGAPVGTDGPVTDSRQPFRDPFSGTHRPQQHPHTRPSKSLSNSRGEREHHRMNPIGNMNGHVNDHRSYGHNAYGQHPRQSDYEDDDDENSEDTPFYLEDQPSTPGLHPHPHIAPAHPQYPPYQLPYPYAMYPPYPVPPQHMSYGYSSTIPPHSNPTNNAAFFNTGRDDPKKRKKIHRRRSEDDLEFATDWAEDGNGFNNTNGWSDSNNTNGWGHSNNANRRGNPNNTNGWGDPNNTNGWTGSNNTNGWDDSNNNDGWGYRNGDDDNNDGNDDNPSFYHHSKTNVPWMNDNRGERSFQRRTAHDGHRRRHVSSPAWGVPIDDNEVEDDLEPGEIRIHANGNINSGGWSSPSRERPRNNVGWGATTDDDPGSPGLGTLDRDLANLRLGQQWNHPHRQHQSSPPDLVDPDSAGEIPRRGPVWGTSVTTDEPTVPYTQPYANERPAYTSDSDRIHRVDHHGTYPITTNDHSSSSTHTTWNAYENHRRRAYVDAFSAGGSGTSIGTSVAGQLKEKAMKWLRGAGISSITLHPILRTPAMLRPNLLTWDVRRKPNPARAGIPIGEAMTAFLEPASKPPLQHMHLIVPIPDLQGTFWHIDVYPNTEDLHGKRQFTFGGSPTSFGKSQRKKRSLSTSYNAGTDHDQYPFYAYDGYAIIQCADVLSALTRMLHMSATSHDYHALSKPRQKQVYDAFMLRCREMEDPSSGRVYTAHTDTNKNTPEVNAKVERKYRGGLKRVDFLCGRTRWEGLEPNGVDSWSVKLGKTIMA